MLGNSNATGASENSRASVTPHAFLVDLRYGQHISATALVATDRAVVDLVGAGNFPSLLAKIMETYNLRIEQIVLTFVPDRSSYAQTTGS